VLGVRPESLSLTAADGDDAHFTTTVLRTEALGSELLVHVEGPESEPWIVRAAPDAALDAGARVGVGILPEQAHLFDAADGRRLGVVGRRDA